MTVWLDKIVNSKNKEFINQFLFFSLTNYNLRENDKKLNVNTILITVVAKCFFCRTINKWNKLTQDLVLCGREEHFQLKLEKDIWII